jgi:hypothetical protein
MADYIVVVVVNLHRLLDGGGGGGAAGDRRRERGAWRAPSADGIGATRFDDGGH